MNYTLSNHAQKELSWRGIPLEIVKKVMDNPDQIVEEYDKKKAYQSIINFESGSEYLVRIIIDDSVEPIVVVTVYRTSKINKYWR